MANQQQDTRSNFVSLVNIIGKRDTIEAEILNLLAELKKQNVTMTEPLVDEEGYPRSDVDVAAIRHIRHEIICKQNDCKELTRRIEEELYALHAEEKITPSASCLNVREVSFKPFARVDLVDENSPAQKAFTCLNNRLFFFKERQENEAVERASIKDTTLTAWFKLNLIDEEAHEYYYADIPEYYVFGNPSTKWQKRQRGGQQVIGRMPVVSVQDSERFYLQMLLLRKTGVISFSVLKTIDGTLCETFQEACKVLGLLDGDQHWHDTLLEAAKMQMPSYLRILFAIICGFGEVENIPDLWTQHKQSLSEDFVHRYSEETGPFYALAELNELLKSYGLNLQKVNLPSVDLQCDLFRLSYDAMEEQSKANANIEKLNSEQRYAVYKVLHAIYEYQTDTPKCFFLDGPAGTDKTFVYSTLLHAVKGKGDQAIAVASTRIAATLLSGGRTAHSIFKIPLTLNATSTCNLKPNTSEAKILLDAKVIVWDEAPMTHVHAFLAVDRLLKDLTKCDEPFGGKMILLGGDFRQVLPVILRGSRSLTVSSCVKKHRLWSDFFVMKLTENMRAFDSEKEFASWLLHVGEGESGEKIQLPPFCYPEIQDPVQQLFSDIDFKTLTPEELKGRAILTVTNDLSMQINNRVLECMPGNEVIYESLDNIVSNDPQDQLAHTEEFLNSLTPTGMPPHKLRLKPGAIIILLRNLAPSKCLCNVKGKGDQAIAVASTRIAATLLSGGRTAHSIFKIPLTLNATSTCNLKPNTSEAKILLDAKVIVWDEAPMTHVHAFLAVDRLLKDLTKCDEPFGGKMILLGGDFRQVLPVILRGSRSLTVSSCVKKHRLWSDFFVMKLTENMRAFDSEKEFASWLLHVGEGESGEKIQLPPFCYPEIQDPVQQLFSDIDFKTLTPEELKGRAILTVTNDLSMQINNRVLECMPGNEVIYESLDNIDLRVGDLLVKFGSLKYRNFENLSAVARLVTENLRKPIHVNVLRCDKVVPLILIPDEWSGNGYLGYDIKHFFNEIFQII
ncbi:hypothetical protein AVEN_270976-1 [Araneus ventricosus]|uniref:ATP-dependent DNA helicase n=1 Tax=Araneus ventricosus TaxID=182803 RepID=A0A4Y2Q0U2_ARAVE|nr:hypothetical protein AVEN_270976-1 [Araneus ventricosus]